MAKWFKNAIFYSLDVETYFDSDADGVGDFKGLVTKLDYLAGLGVTCLWLLPYYPSPNRDNGYDVKDYYGVDTRLGDPGDFVQFMSRCRELGIRVIIDLVINHTSIEHPWFQMARQDKNSPYRDFYIWSDKPKPFTQQHLTFHGEEDTLWTYDDLAGQYYLHRFYKEQPDLNIGCSRLRAEILKIIEYWLTFRVDGFRIDAAEMLIEMYGMEKADEHNLEMFLEEIRSVVASRNPDAVLLAEANIPPGKAHVYLREDKRMHMLFNFFGNQHLFLAFATGDAQVLRKAFEKLPAMPQQQQWLNFLRHHDELSLQLLSDKEVGDVFSVFAPREEMRIYHKGIRRRLAPMVGNDRRKLFLLYSLLFSLPGAVLLRYGDEIGMGDDLSLAGRTSVRTPMQWSPAKNGGFSKAPAENLVHPPVNEGEFSFEKINVLAQQRDPDSLLNFIERLITTRKQTPAIGSGNYRFIKSPSDHVLIHACVDDVDNAIMLFIHNLADEAFTVSRKELIGSGDLVFEIFCDAVSTLNDDMLSLTGYGYLWLRIENKN